MIYGFSADVFATSTMLAELLVPTRQVSLSRSASPSLNAELRATRFGPVTCISPRRVRSERRAVAGLCLALGLVLVGCGSTESPPTEPAQVTRSEPTHVENQGPTRDCLPVIGGCGCSYACGESVGVADSGNALVRTTSRLDREPVEAVRERWCQPEGA